MEFSDWLKRPLASFNSDVVELDALEARLEDSENVRLFYGQLQCRCCCCGEWTESPVGIEELEPVETFNEHYCGGSPRCCP